MTTTPTHSPLPWHIDEEGDVGDPNGNTVAFPCYPQDPTACHDRGYADAKFIVTACNGHAELTEALTCLTILAEHNGLGNHWQCIKARSALAAAGEKP